MAHLPDDFYRLIGRIVVASAEVDYTLGGIASELIGGRAPWAIVVAGQSYSQLDQILRTICGLMEQPSAQALKDLLDQVKPLHDRRNLVAHGTWAPIDVHAYFEGGEPGAHMAVKPQRWKDVLTGRIFKADVLTEMAEALDSKAAQLRKYQADDIALIQWKPKV